MRRVGAVLVLVLLSLLALPSARGSERELPELAGTTIVTATASGYVDVVLPRSTRISRASGRNPDFRFEGNGRIVGLVLVAQNAPWAEAYEIDFTRWDFCGRRACAPKRPIEFAVAVHWKRSQITDKHWIVPRGRYRMYVITDGAPVRLEVTFGDLDGEVHLQPQHEATIGVRQPQVMTPRDQRNVIVAEDAFEMTSPGLMVEGNQQTVDTGAGLDSACYTRAGNHVPTPDDPFAKGYCGGGATTHLAPPGDFPITWGIYAWHPAKAGRWESRFTYTYAGLTEGMEFLNVWVSFD